MFPMRKVQAAIFCLQPINWKAWQAVLYVLMASKAGMFGLKGMVWSPFHRHLPQWATRKVAPSK